MTSTKGGNLVGPNTEERWKALPETLEQAEGGVALYQPLHLGEHRLGLTANDSTAADTPY